MLYIPPDSKKIKAAKQEFHSAMQDFVFKRIDGLKQRSYYCSGLSTFFSNNINDRIDDILVGDPLTLEKINLHINPFIQFSELFKKGVEYVFNYTRFSKKSSRRYDAYQLAESLDINTCVYCNRNYTSTVIKDKGEKITRPTFDHFFDKSNNPLLALSFYNLIPSCSICNSGLKGTETMSLEKHLHPYLDNKIKDIKFTYRYSTEFKTDYKIKIKTEASSREFNTVKLFALEEIYNSHSSELEDLIKTRDHFSDRYLSILEANLLRDAEVSKESLYRIVFGTEMDSTNFINKPFSKFKSDILKELGIIG